MKGKPSVGSGRWCYMFHAVNPSVLPIAVDGHVLVTLTTVSSWLIKPADCLLIDMVFSKG
jgi:hypothetical protein